MDYSNQVYFESFSSERAELSCALSKAKLPCVLLITSESRGVQTAEYDNVVDLSLHGSEHILGKKDNVRIDELSYESCSKDKSIKSLNGSVIALFEKPLIQIVRLGIMKFDSPTRQELIHGREFVQQHNAQVGQEVRIPLKYKGKVNLHSSVRRGKHYFNISQVIKDFPPCICVEEELTVIKDNGQGCCVLPRGLKLIVMKVDSSSEEVGKDSVLVCRCDSTVLHLPSTCQGHFTASVDETGYTLQEIVETFSVPKTVTFNKLENKDFISVSELDNDRLFNALSGPVEILAVEKIELYIGCKHQTSDRMLNDIVALPTFLNLSVHLPKDEVNNNRLLEEYVLNPTIKLVHFIESNLFSIPSDSRAPIYLNFPGPENLPFAGHLLDHEKEMKSSSPLYDAPSASAPPGKPLCSKDTGPRLPKTLELAAGLKRRRENVEESIQRLLLDESVLAKTIENKETVECQCQQSLKPDGGKQLAPHHSEPGHLFENDEKSQGMSDYTRLFRDTDNYDVAAEDSNDYEAIEINDDDYEYVGFPNVSSSLTSPSEAKREATGHPGTGRFAVKPKEESIWLTPVYENVDTNKITTNKEKGAFGNPQRQDAADLSASSQNLALYKNTLFKGKSK